MEPSDEELCRRIAERDADAFELMVDRHQGRAYRLAASVLGNEADARDVSQDAFIRLYESAGRFDGRSRGFGFVEMKNEDEAAVALRAMNGKELAGRPLRVEAATSQRRPFDRNAARA